MPNAEPTPQSPSRRKAHRRGAGRALAATGEAQAPKAARQCVVCRAAKPVAHLLQLRDVQSAPAKTGRHVYACVARACLLKVGMRLGTGAGGAQGFVASLAQLACVRLTGTIGLARRQGILVLGAARIVAARPPSELSGFGAELDGADFAADDDDDEDDIIVDEDDDEGDDDYDDDDDVFEDGNFEGQGHTAHGQNGTVQSRGRRPRRARRAQDVVLVACDAAPRTVRSLGDSGRACMLSSAAMGHAAGGAAVAAVAIPPGRLALQAVYWLQVWYETRSADAGDMTDSSQRSIEVA